MPSQAEKNFKIYLEKLGKLEKCMNMKCRKLKKELEKAQKQNAEKSMKIIDDIQNNKISQQKGMAMIGKTIDELYKSIEQKKVFECSLQKCYKQNYNLMMVRPLLHKNKTTLSEYDKLVDKYVAKFKKQKHISVQDLLDYESDTRKALLKL
jgi:hypothetical protein